MIPDWSKVAGYRRRIDAAWGQVEPRHQAVLDRYTTEMRQALAAHGIDTKNEQQMFAVVVGAGTAYFTTRFHAEHVCDTSSCLAAFQVHHEAGSRRYGFALRSILQDLDIPSATSAQQGDPA